MAGLYVHIPFCKQACLYCDFHFSTQLKHKEELVNALCLELEQRKNYLSSSHLETIYFGGGTPSLLSENELQKIFDTLHRLYTWNTDTEITIECNPDDLSVTTIQLLLKFGFNRLSIGLQSFLDEELKWMNRAHTAQESLACVKRVKDLGFVNISIDLMYGSKFQTLSLWEKTLTQVVELDVQHISAYNLTIETKTALGVQHTKGLEPLIDEQLSSNQFLMMIDYLPSHQFIHYEISNFGKENLFSKHNSRYWLGYSYLGIGPSAHSFNGQTRQWNVSNNTNYIKQVSLNTNYFELEQLNTDNKYNEYILTHLRTIWGCDLNEIAESFGERYVLHFTTEIKKMEDFLNKRGNIYCLNNRGKLMADKLAMELFV